MEAKSVTQVQETFKKASNGGCLGYGVSGKCGKLKVTAFHVEFDTWQNKGDPNTDPTSSDHIGVMLNGDPGKHVVWAALADLENNKWHDARIDVDGTKVTVYWDGKVKVTKNVPGLDFRGGYIAISGSTGWATNFHRLDDLVILHQCQ